MVQPVLPVEPSWLAQPHRAAQILSVLKSHGDRTGPSSAVSHLLASARDLSQTVKIHIAASLPW